MAAAPIFPSDFVFGSATASYQIEGAVAEGGRLPSIWDTFSHTPGKVVGGDTGDVADDHYHRLDEDLDLMASYNLDAYRFSIAWPRIQPGGSGPVNPEGVAFYDRLIDGLLERGITPTATLYHWDLPQALEDAGGWPSRATAERFAEYAALCGAAFGDRITTWTTINEPWCIAYLGYALGVHAPGRRNLTDAFAAVHHVNLAHGLAVQALRASASGSPQYSITNNLDTVRPASAEPADVQAAALYRMLANEVWTGPQLRGAYPEGLFEVTAPVADWSWVRDGDLAVINQPIDVLGLNWYTPHYVRAATTAGPGGLGLPLEFVDLPGERTDIGWLIDDSGLEEMLVGLGRDFPGLPIVVTENGAAYDDAVVAGRVHDERRVRYLHDHIAATHRAMAAGVPVVGYYVWSLLDNFEWAEGYAKRFGITHVDYDTLVRTPKDSALWFAELARTKVLPPRP